MTIGKQSPEAIARGLSKAQSRVLNRAALLTYSDSSGDGYAVYDRTELGVAERLARAGLVTIGMPSGGAPFGRVRVTLAGRAHLLAQADKS